MKISDEDKFEEKVGICICCGKIEEEFDSICLECKKLERYPNKIYGV